MRNSKGITLVSLIITIIVMVILAGVALIFSVGEEGVMTQAENAKKTQANKEEEERVSLAVLDAKTSSLSSNGKIVFNETLIKEAVEKEFGVGSCTVTEETDYFVVTMLNSNNEYKISKLENGNIPTQVSIEGKYGYDNRPNENRYLYYIFDEDTSIGQYFEDHSNYASGVNFSYIMDENGNGTITFEDGSTQTFKFEGTENNKVIYIINLWGDNTNVAYTTNWADGLDKINNGTYEVHEDGEYKGEAIFNNNMLRIEYTNGWIDEDTDNYFVKDNCLYMLMSDEDEPNYYFTCYKIEGNKLISLMS